MRVDTTINIPTLCSLLGTLGAVCAFGMGIYQDLDKRQMRTDAAVAEIRYRMDKAENAIIATKADQAAQIGTIRGELKGDIGEIKGMLNQLIFGSSAGSRALEKWRKE